MNPPLAVATAVTFVWLGMVLAISFLETPLKFRAPEVTLPVGLGIGRVVFRALNAVEAALAVVLTIAGLLGSATSSPLPRAAPGPALADGGRGHRGRVRAAAGRPQPRRPQQRREDGGRYWCRHTRERGGSRT